MAAAVGVGAAAWAGVGDLTLADAFPGAARVGLLPPWWWLAVSMAAAAGVMAGVRNAGGRWLPLAASGLTILPWLPGPWPVASLAWAGPLGGFLMVSAVAAAIATRVPSSPGIRPSWPSARFAPLVAFVAATTVYLAAGWRIMPVLPAGDEPHYLVITQSLLADHDLAIENNHRQGDYRAYINQPLRPDFLRRGTDGQIYSIHLPGTSVLVAPAFALGGYAAVKVWLSVLAGAASALAWRTAYVLAGSAAAAWFGWAATAMTAPFLLLAFTVYPDGPGAACVMVALSALVSLSRRNGRAAAWWAGIGALCAVLPWLHPRFAVLAAALGVVFVLRALREPARATAVVAFAAWPALSAAGWFGYYYLIYGTPNPSVAYGYYTQMAVSNAARGLLGLLFDQQFGLVATAPVLAVVAAGVVALGRAHRRLAFEWAAIVVPYVVVSAMYHMWWGGHSSPARFLGPVVLACAIPVAMAWRRASTAATRSLMAVLMAVSLMLIAVVVLVGDGRLVFNSRDGMARWALWATRGADIVRGLPSVFRTEPGTTAAATAGWVVAVLLVWALARAAERRAVVSRGAAGLAIVAGLVVAASGAMTASWRLEGTGGQAPAAGQGRLLERAAAGDAAFGVVSSPYGLPATPDVVRELRLAGDSVGKPPWACYWQAPMPSGSYRLVADARSGGGPLSFDVVLGRGDVAFETWSLEASRPGRVSREFVLPRGVRSLALRASPDTTARLSRLVVEPILGPSDPTFEDARVTASVKYGQTVVLAVGNAIDVERQGAWVRALAPAEFLVVAPADRPVQRLALRAGPVPTGLELDAGSWRLTLRLGAGETRDVDVPLAAGRGTLHVRTDAGFRPASVDPTSTDTRHLGVWIEFR